MTAGWLGLLPLFSVGAHTNREASFVTTIIIGAMFRAIGAYPSGWRTPGAHSNPREDAAVIRAAALKAEAAGLDYIFFGDWLATGPDLEYRDPYLIARIEPLTAATWLAGITERIGLIATVNSTYADPYSIARATASADTLSGGRIGLNLVTGAEPRAAGNHGRDAHADNDARYDRAEQFVEVLHRLWDSFEDDAIVGDKENGIFLDPSKLHSTDYTGSQLSVTGPLNAARPPQGHLPIIHAGTSPRSRQLVSEAADLALVASSRLEDTVALRNRLKAQAAAAGRDPEQLKIITPVAPVV
ncbi:MAG: class flavin-dependent oxidoreductase, partial [Glaciihabitans sp.]|nr:class flavin-dependent oxidoreductase [Glaciihabitans sp.]